MIRVRTSGVVAGFLTLCSIAVSGLYLAAIVASAVSSAAPFDPWETIPFITFVALIIMGALLGGGAVTWAESSVDEHTWTRRIGLALFLVATIASILGAVVMVLLPLVFIPAAIVLVVIVARRQFGGSIS